MSDEFQRGFDAAMQLQQMSRMSGPEALAWAEAEQAKHRAVRAAECDANGRHMVIECDTAFCGHCDRRYEEGPGI